MDPHTSESLLLALRARGVVRLCGVTFRRTRRVLFSVTGRGTRLSLNAAFRCAPPEILDALATALTARRGVSSRAAALNRIRAWPPLEHALRDARSDHAAKYGPSPALRGRCVATAAQREDLYGLYARLNLDRFGGRLPADVPIRVSGRMRRRLGHVRYDEADGERRLLEIALGAVLLLPANAAHLLDTLLHEMAHAEAFLDHGERGHGRTWKQIARRVGCEPRACTTRRVVRR